jgi:ribonuclease BN (tRNA processing enzyme)
MKITFLGTGDAFGSGGRLQTCIALHASVGILIDCGATALTGMKRYGVDPASIDAVVLTHLHGDHFAGLAYLIRETQIASARTRPLTIIGPPGVERVVWATTELLFPGAVASRATFELRFIEYAPNEPTSSGGLTVLAVPAIHTAGTHPHSVRVGIDGYAVAYSGDTEWTDNLLGVSQGADLFVCEAYSLEPFRNHMDWRTLTLNMPRLGCHRLMLTHMSAEMLALTDTGVADRADDGQTIVL